MSEYLTEDSVLKFLQATAIEGDRVPALREIADHFGLSTTSSIRRLLDRLEQQGFVKRESYKARSIQLTEKASPHRGLPILGRIAAGPPTEAVQSIKGYIDIGKRFDSERYFGLEVKGDSMIDAHIVDGDVAVIQRQETCEDGEIAAVVLTDDNEATLKRVFFKRGYVQLVPANRKLKPIRAKNVAIMGVLVSLLRDY